MFILPGLSAIVKFNYWARLHEFHIGCGINLVWKKRAIDLRSLMTMAGFGDPQKTCPTSFDANFILKKSLA